jgi:hypothetical protein
MLRRSRPRARPDPLAMPIGTRTRRAPQKLIDAIRNGFLTNPFAWILLLLLALAEYHNHQIARDLQQVCELIGPHDVWFEHPETPRQVIDTICISHQPVDASDDQ